MTNNQQQNLNPNIPSLQSYNILPKIDLLKYLGKHFKLNSDKGDTLKRKREIDNHSITNDNSNVLKNKTHDDKPIINNNININKYFRVKDKLIK